MLYVHACSLESPGPGVLRKFGAGAHDFFALQGCTLIASPRDALTYGIQRWKSGADDGIRVTTHSGHHDMPVGRCAPPCLRISQKHSEFLFPVCLAPYIVLLEFLWCFLCFAC